MKSCITHVGFEIKAVVIDEAFELAKQFNREHLDGKMKAIVADEVDKNTYWVTLAETESLARVKHEQSLQDESWR